MIIHLDKEIYSTVAVLSTSLELADKFTIVIVNSDPTLTINVTCCDGGVLDMHAEKLFFESLAQSELRTRLRTLFAPVEKLIVEKAFAPISNEL